MSGFGGSGSDLCRGLGTTGGAAVLLCERGVSGMELERGEGQIGSEERLTVKMDCFGALEPEK